LGDQIEKTGVRGACSTYGGRVEMYAEFYWENLREGDHLEDRGINFRIILKWIFKK
jgi:hypothetical protein